MILPITISLYWQCRINLQTFGDFWDRGPVSQQVAAVRREPAHKNLKLCSEELPIQCNPVPSTALKILLFTALPWRPLARATLPCKLEGNSVARDRSCRERKSIQMPINRIDLTSKYTERAFGTNKLETISAILHYAEPLRVYSRTWSAWSVTIACVTRMIMMGPPRNSWTFSLKLCYIMVV